eukprot:c25025_g1_i1 orf=302-529(+)
MARIIGSVMVSLFAVLCVVVCHLHLVVAAPSPAPASSSDAPVPAPSSGADAAVLTSVFSVASLLATLVTAALFVR